MYPTKFLFYLESKQPKRQYDKTFFIRGNLNNIGNK